MNSLACNPQSLVCNPQSLACNPQSLACGVGLPGGGLVRLPVQSEGDAFAPLPEGWDAVEQAPQQPDVPAAGYFDYDENWFDEQGQ